MKNWIFIIFFIFLVSPVYAIDGKIWEVMNENEKRFYLSGIQDGYSDPYYAAVAIACEGLDVANNPCAKKALTQLFSNPLIFFDVELLVRMIDSLYSDPFNNKIKVTTLVKLAIKKSEGKSIDTDINRAREVISFFNKPVEN